MRAGDWNSFPDSATLHPGYNTGYLLFRSCSPDEA